MSVRPLSASLPGLLRIWTIAIAIVAIPLSADQILIRNWYVHWLEPDSTAGMLMLAGGVVDAQMRKDRDNVLVIGDSRIAEGFAPALADQAVGDRKMHFIRLGLPGTTPRVWSFLLDRIDPHRDRFRAIYLMAPSLRDEDEQEDLADRRLDTAYLAGTLRLSDLRVYSESFPEQQGRRDARESILFPAASLGHDMVAFLSAPWRRLDKVRLWRSDYPRWLETYRGHSERLPDPAPGADRSALIAAQPSDRRDEIARYLEATLEPGGKERDHSFAYRSRWYGGIADHYHSTAVTIGVFLVPRGPYHAWMGVAPQARGALPSLADKRILHLLAPGEATPFEEPRYFFDHLHLNATGRDAYSASLGRAIAQDLEEPVR